MVYLVAVDPSPVKEMEVESPSGMFKEHVVVGVQGERLAVSEAEKGFWGDRQRPALLGFILLLMTSGTKPVMGIQVEFSGNKTRAQEKALAQRSGPTDLNMDKNTIVPYTSGFCCVFQLSS